MPRIVFDPEAPAAAEADRACSVLSRLSGEPTIGRAVPKMQGWLLVEDNGPWGNVSAVRSPRLPDELTARIRSRQLRANLIRRHRRERGAQPRTVMVAYTDGAGGWLEIAEADDPIALAQTIDLDAVAAGERPHVGDLAAQPVVLACTHGGVDPCCAKFGRPVAAALSEAYGPVVWEASHVGGCRFAPNIICLPSGVVYGHTDPGLAVRQVGELLAGRLVGDGLRGRLATPRAVQVAELAVRRQTGRWELDAVDTLEHNESADEHQVSLAVDGRRFVVTLAGRLAPPRVRGCGDDDIISPDEFRIVDVSEPHASLAP